MGLPTLDPAPRPVKGDCVGVGLALRGCPVEDEPNSASSLRSAQAARLYSKGSVRCGGICPRIRPCHRHGDTGDDDGRRSRSMVYAGAHLPIDVFGGAGLGILSGASARHGDQPHHKVDGRDAAGAARVGPSRSVDRHLAGMGVEFPDVTGDGSF